MTEEQLNEILSGMTSEEFEEEFEYPEANYDGFCEGYFIRADLRKKFQNSYFLSDMYDDSIVGVNFFTGSIIYDLKDLGWLHTVHAEGHAGDLGDCIECGGFVTNRMLKLKVGQLARMVPPTIIVSNDEIEHWDHVRGYLSVDHIGGLLADGLI